MAGQSRPEGRHRFRSPMPGHPRLNFPDRKTWIARDICAKTRFALLPGHDDRSHVAIGAGMERKALVTCQNSFRLVASATECAVPGRMMNWRSPFGSLL